MILGYLLGLARENRIGPLAENERVDPWKMGLVPGLSGRTIERIEWIEQARIEGAHPALLGIPGFIFSVNRVSFLVLPI